MWPLMSCVWIFCSSWIGGHTWKVSPQSIQPLQRREWDDNLRVVLLLNDIRQCYTLKISGLISTGQYQRHTRDKPQQWDPRLRSVKKKGPFQGQKPWTTRPVVPSLHILQLDVAGLTFPKCEILAKILKDYNIDVAITPGNSERRWQKCCKEKDCRLQPQSLR